MKKLLTLMMLTCLPVTAPASSEEPQLLRETYFSNATGHERDYFVYLPADFSQRQSWPVILFLHGHGERGNGKSELDFVVTHGPLYEAWIQKRNLPFVIIAPQLPMYEFADVESFLDRNIDDVPRRLQEGIPDRKSKAGSDEPMERSKSKMPDRYGIEGPPSGWPLQHEELIDMVDNIIGKFRGDPQRIYLSGLSYGGFGAWYMASKYPERFAAVNPVVGYAHPDLIDSIAKHRLPVWCFAGGRDATVPVEYFYAGMNKLERLDDEDIRFTVEEDMSHDVWKRVYAGEDIYIWLLSYTK